LVDLFVNAPDDAGRALAMATLGGDDTNRVATAAYEWLLRPAEESGGEPEKPLLTALEARGGPYRAWNPNLRGQPPWLYPDTRQQYAAVLNAFAQTKRRHRHRLVTQNDALELHMSERRMVQFVDAVKEMQKIADHTFVWLAPRNTELLQPTRAGLARLA